MTIAYICDGQKVCPKKEGSCGIWCKHTTDLGHAKNYDHIPTKEELNKDFVRYGVESDADYFEKEV